MALASGMLHQATLQSNSFPTCGTSIATCTECQASHWPCLFTAVRRRMIIVNFTNASCSDRHLRHKPALWHSLDHLSDESTTQPLVLETRCRVCSSLPPRAYAAWLLISCCSASFAAFCTARASSSCLIFSCRSAAAMTTAS